jgi:diguanylate cyclase (GGDEF)-like protein
MPIDSAWLVSTQDHYTTSGEEMEIAAVTGKLRRAERLARCCGSQFALLFIDVDGFKQVNDTFGHRAGDQALRTIAHQLRACVRPEDFIAWYGGDEFVVLMENPLDDTEVERICARLRSGLLVPITPAGKRLTMTASIGAAVSGGRGAISARDLLDVADQGMYHEKTARFAKMPARPRRASLVRTPSGSLPASNASRLA